jgi:hypothetical protein
LVSTSIISRNLQEMLDVLVFEDLLDARWAEIDPGPRATAARRRQLDARTILQHTRAGEHAAQGLLHDGVQAPVLTGCESLGLGKEILI